MQIDARLNEIDDCLYRVAVRIFAVQDNKVLLIKEASDGWWALPGGGVDHGETIEMAVLREIREELGIPADRVISDFQIAHYNLGNVINSVPRMNLFFKVSFADTTPKLTDEASEWRWFDRDDFLRHEMHSSYNKSELLTVIFGD